MREGLAEGSREAIGRSIEERRSFFSERVGRYERGLLVRESVVRLDQERAVADSLRAGRPVVIRGVWRAGKTSLGHALRRNFPGPFVHEDVGPYGTELSAESFRTSLAETVDGQSGNERTIVIDEAIALADRPDLLVVIDGLRVPGVRLAVVAHWTRDTDQTMRRAFDGYDSHFVRGLTKDEVRLVALRPFAGTPVAFTDAAIDRLASLSGGRPLEVQLLCSALLDPSKPFWRDDATFDAADVDRLSGNETAMRQLADEGLSHYRKVYDFAFDDEDRALFRSIAENGGVAAGDADPVRVQPLLDIGYLRRDGDGSYRANGELFERFVRTRVKNS
ncbi:MAG: hypothetical protein WCO25_02225 [Candidatus Uhrbacteria bacterium]